MVADDQALLDHPASQSIGPEVLFASGWAPVELKTAATKQFQSDLAKYSSFRGVPDFGVYTGYLAADLMIKGLQASGKTPTRDSYIAATARRHGLTLANPINTIKFLEGI